MKKLFICFLVSSSIISQNKKEELLIKKSELQLVKDSKVKEITINQENDFSLDLQQLSDGLIKEKIVCKAGKYNIEFSNEFPHGSITFDVADNTRIQTFEKFNTHCSFRGGKNCDKTGFNCLVLFPKDIQMQVIPKFDKKYHLRRIRFIIIKPSFFNVWEDPNNPNGGCTNNRNPYDKIGLMHNEQLTSLLAITQNKSVDNLSEIVQIYSDIYPDFVPISREIRAKNSVFSFQLNQLSKEGQLFAKKMFLTIDSNDNPDLLYGQFIELENELLNSNQLTEKEKTTLLKMAAVGRYSYYFWNNQLNFVSLRKIKKERLKEIVKADLEGASIGVSIGGAIGGPQGAAVGALGGAVIGSCVAYVRPKTDTISQPINKEHNTLKR